MYRVALSVMLGTVSMLVTYVQFRALPGQENNLDLTTTLREALIVCGSIDGRGLCPFPLDYLSQVNTLPGATIIFLIAVKFAVLLTFD
jgi:hypothetical protein